MGSCRCKMCGGQIHYDGDVSVATCEFCGTEQTIVKTDDVKQLKLFSRANTLRMQNEFDKAQTTYENILIDDPNNAEAHWGICLCRYGIEYVDDKKTGKKIPTCHRTVYKFIFDDLDYKETINNADVVAKRVYEAEAKNIDKIQKSILEISQKEDPYDIFLCYKENDDNGKRTKDSIIAQTIYEELLKKGYKVFFSRISLESKIGTNYEPIIFAALMSSKIMLAIGSQPEYYNAPWVKNEWGRFLSFMKDDKSKHLIPCYLDMDAYEMPEEFSVLQSQDIGKIGYMQDLLRGIDKLFNSKSKNVIENTNAPSVKNPTLKPLIDNCIGIINSCPISHADIEIIKHLSDDIKHIDYSSEYALLLDFIYELDKKNKCDYEIVNKIIDKNDDYAFELIVSIIKKYLFKDLDYIFNFDSRLYSFDAEDIKKSMKLEKELYSQFSGMINSSINSLLKLSNHIDVSEIIKRVIDTCLDNFKKLYDEYFELSLIQKDGKIDKLPFNRVNNYYGIRFASIVFNALKKNEYDVSKISNLASLFYDFFKNNIVFAASWCTKENIDDVIYMSGKDKKALYDASINVCYGSIKGSFLNTNKKANISFYGDRLEISEFGDNVTYCIYKKEILVSYICTGNQNKKCIIYFKFKDKWFSKFNFLFDDSIARLFFASDLLSSYGCNVQINELEPKNISFPPRTYTNTFASRYTADEFEVQEKEKNNAAVVAVLVIIIFCVICVIFGALSNQ